MKYLTDDQTEELVNQPETGMGYQEVEITTSDGQTYDATVMNAEELVEDLPIDPDDIVDIRVK